jgi:multicomponent Na+:H+ antiporter subunit G
MELALDIVSALLLVTGGLFSVIGGVGILRLPDFYTRTHAASIPDTMGAGLVLIGLALQAPHWIVAVKLLAILCFLLFTSPTSGHALVKAAYAHGVRWLEGDQAALAADPNTEEAAALREGGDVD